MIYTEDIGIFRGIAIGNFMKVNLNASSKIVVFRFNSLIIGGVFVGPFVPPATVTRLGDLKILENTIRLPCYERACFWARGVHLAKSIFFVHLHLK